MSIFGSLFISSKKKAYQKYASTARKVKNKGGSYKHALGVTKRKFRRGKMKFK